MYAFLEGRIESLGPPVVLAVGGVGYEVWVPERVARGLLGAGEPVRLHTHLAVREDDMTLYGFATAAQREIFRALISVNGVGPKVGLAILGDVGADGVLRGIQRGDAKPLLAIKGVGKKTAERIVIDLEEKAAAWVELGPTPAHLAAPDETPDETPVDPQGDEVRMALLELGVSPERADSAIAALRADGVESDRIEDLLREALRRLHPAR